MRKCEAQNLACEVFDSLAEVVISADNNFVVIKSNRLALNKPMLDKLSAHKDFITIVVDSSVNYLDIFYSVD